MSRGEPRNNILVKRNPDKSSINLQLLHTLIDNVLKHPAEEKYRSFRATNQTISRKCLQVPGGTELLIEVGFRTKVVQMQESWALPFASSPAPLLRPLDTSTVYPLTGGGLTRIGWTKLRLAEKALRERKIEVEEQTERVKRNAAAEAEIEKNRKSRALEEFHADREAKARKDARDRKAREELARIEAEQARAEAELAAAAALAGASTSAQPHEHA